MICQNLCSPYVLQLFQPLNSCYVFVDKKQVPALEKTLQSATFFHRVTLLF